MGLDVRKPVFGFCEQQRRRPACACMQSDQLLCYVQYQVLELTRKLGLFVGFKPKIPCSVFQRQQCQCHEVLP